jgi:hypothetical protein
LRYFFWFCQGVHPKKKIKDYVLLALSLALYGGFYRKNYMLEVLCHASHSARGIGPAKRV